MERLNNILNQSKLISLYEKKNIMEGKTNFKGEYGYRYFVNMRDKINNPLHVSSFEFYTRNKPYNNGSRIKFRVYHGGKMPKLVHEELESLNHVISDSKDYIDFASKDINNIIKVAKQIYNILSVYSDKDIQKIESSTKDDHVEYIEIDDLENIEFEEGMTIQKIIEYKKRNKKARELKLQQFKKQHGKIFCERCNEDDIAVIDVHHSKTKISDMKGNHKTKLSDLLVVCSNCHRRIHYYKTDGQSIKKTNL